MKKLVGFYKYKNKKYSKDLILLSVIFMGTLISVLTSNNWISRVLFSLIALFILTGIVINIEGFYSELKKDSAV
ncbi:MAG: hypothetical protein ACRCWG_06100 [Sarcina sp.]